MKLRTALLTLALLAAAIPSSAQNRGVVYGDVGYASIGHADSEQGKAPIFGGGAALQVTPHLLVEADVHRGTVENVFGRARHDFSETTFTASFLFRTPVDGPAHLVAGGGIAVQRAHTELDEPSLPPIDRTETLRLWHGKLGVDWDLTRRVVLRTHGVLSMGGGLDWVFGARVGLGYRF
jgi:hypothetical protein